METTKFKTGATYKTTFIGDSNLVVPTTIVRRTEKTAWARLENTGKVVKKKIHTYRDEEYILPYGSYSMAPSCYAGKEIN